MKVILYDHSNNGVLYVGDNLIVVNHLKRGLVDTDMRSLGPRTPGYNKISKADILQNDKHVQLTRSNDIIDLSIEGQNSIYLERRRLVRLRASLMERVCYSAWLTAGRSKLSPWDGFENNLEYTLRTSNPETESWSDALLEYAYINNITPQAAYRELTLHYENVHSLKMRIYATLIYFTDKINKVTSVDETGPMTEEIIDRFWRDAWI